MCYFKWGQGKWIFSHSDANVSAQGDCDILNCDLLYSPVHAVSFTLQLPDGYYLLFKIEMYMVDLS